jgi:hypothetical protein
VSPLWLIRFVRSVLFSLLIFWFPSVSSPIWRSDFSYRPLRSALPAFSCVDFSCSAFSVPAVQAACSFFVSRWPLHVARSSQARFSFFTKVFFVSASRDEFVCRSEFPAPVRFSCHELRVPVRSLCPDSISSHADDSWVLLSFARSRLKPSAVRCVTVQSFSFPARSSIWQQTHCPMLQD